MLNFYCLISFDSVRFFKFPDKGSQCLHPLLFKEQGLIATGPINMMLNAMR